jgi:hypothetical protein
MTVHTCDDVCGPPSERRSGRKGGRDGEACRGCGFRANLRKEQVENPIKAGWGQPPPTQNADSGVHSH